MLNDVLPSDVELAHQMIDSGIPDSEIVAALQMRGLDFSKASELVDGLRKNQNLRSKTLETTEPPVLDLPGDSIINPTGKKMQKVRGMTGPKREGVPWWFLILLVSFLWALGYCLLHDENDVSNIGRSKAPPTQSEDSTLERER